MSQTNPNYSRVRPNKALTNFSQKYLQDQNEFVSLRAMPNLPVGKKSDLYYMYNIGDFNRAQAKERAPGTESAGGSYRLSTEPYFCRRYDFHKDITDEDRVEAESPIMVEQDASQFVAQSCLVTREKKFAESFMDGARWGTDKTDATWGDPSSEPVVEVRDAKRAIKSRTGMRANKAIIGEPLYDLLLDHPAILSLMDGGATTDRLAIVNRQRLAAIFELDEIFVMGAVYNDAQENTDPDVRDMKFIVENDMLLYHAPNSVGVNTPTAGAQFSWTGLLGGGHGLPNNSMRTKKFRMEHIESDRIEGSMAFDYKVTGKDLGYYFTNAAKAS
jgi:hypothetical protein